MASSSVSLDERKAELQALATASAKAAEDSAAKLRGEDARLKTLRESLNKEKLQVEQSKAEVIASFAINMRV
jgi:membrane-bound ClpP family serine protease